MRDGRLRSCSGRLGAPCPNTGLYGKALSQYLGPAARGRPQIHNRDAGTQQTVFFVNFYELEGRPGPIPLLLGLPHIGIGNVSLNPGGIGLVLGQTRCAF